MTVNLIHARIMAYVWMASIHLPVIALMDSLEITVPLVS